MAKLQRVEALPDGMPFAQWQEAAGLSRSTAYKYAATLTIRRGRRTDPATGQEVPWLSGPDVDALEALLELLRQGLKLEEAAAQLGHGGGALAPREPSAVIVTEAAEIPADSAPIREEESEGSELQQLRWRLQALRDAVELGAPLSSREAELLLGARPIAPLGEASRRAGITAEHLARGLWRLSRAESTRNRW